MITRLLFTIGMKMVPVLLGWYLYNLTESKLVLGLVGLSEVIPAILLALPAGVTADSSDKKSLIIKSLAFYSLAVVGLILTLKDSSYAGVGRDDGKEGGEFSPDFFNKKRYEKMADSTFWLSPTPQQLGKGWDAALPRICTWVKLKDRESKMIFFVFNTHFDHIGKVAREESAGLLLRQIYRIAGKSPVILTGDFNSEEKDTPIRILTGLSELSVYAFSDAMYISRLPHHGSIPTYCGFDIREVIAGGRIDYIFVSAGISVRNHATLTDFEGSHFPSDHFPVISELQLQQ